MRNIANMKRLVNPETVDKGEIDPQPQLAASAARTGSHESQP